jgi:hypothetical protein
MSRIFGAKGESPSAAQAAEKIGHLRDIQFLPDARMI